MKNNQFLKSFIGGLFCLLMIGWLPAQSSKINSKAIESYVQHIQKRHEIPGVALAILRKGEVIFQKNFGNASIEHNSPIRDESIFRVYSLTKPIVAVAIFQLIEQGKLSLDDSIEKYVDGLPATWRKIQIKHLLTHASGLPDMAPFTRMHAIDEEQARDTVFQQQMKSDIGEVYQYNQTNFWLLQKIIEHASQETLEEFIAKNQFDDERKHVFFSSNSKEIVLHRVTPYFPFETGTIQIDHSTIKGRYMLAANGLNITLKEFVQWDQRLRNNQLLKEETKEKMFQTFPYTKSNKLFTYGWDKRMLNNHESYGFSGSLITAYRVFPQDDLSIIFLSNGLGNYYNIENIINYIASLVDDDIINHQNNAFETLSQSIVDGDKGELNRSFSTLVKKHDAGKINLEVALNDVGYQLINQRRLEKALAAFQLNTKKFPKSANTFDSLGEIYLMLNDLELAERNYKKAIALGGTQGNAKTMLDRIQQTKKN